MNAPLSWFTPLPPARNGIADYSAMLLREISARRECVVYSEDLGSGVAPEIEIRDPAQAFRHLKAQTPILHQIGNNGGHVFVLKALRRHGGVVSLHDLSLLYLYELESPRIEGILSRLPTQTGSLGEAYARHWKSHNIKTAANYILFDLVGEVLSLARRVIVHSAYARNKLAAIHGPAAARKIDVIPHFAPLLRAGTHEAARAAIGIEPQETLILTSGFATRAKRFDWLVEALDRLAQAGLSFRWVHAGEERPQEVDLSGMIARRPALGARSMITGYASEDLLDGYIAAADVVVNLRFPSVGESSGTLARAFSAGRCCIVNDTAAYSELPRDCVVHLPVFDTTNALARALGALIGNRDLRESFGARARLFAETELSIGSIADRYLASIDRAMADGAISSFDPVIAKPRRQEIRQIERLLSASDDLQDLAADLGDEAGPFELTIWFSSREAFSERAMRSPAMLRKAVPPHVEISSMRFVSRKGVNSPGAERWGSELGIALAGKCHAGSLVQ